METIETRFFWQQISVLFQRFNPQRDICQKLTLHQTTSHSDILFSSFSFLTPGNFYYRR